jgi:heme-degrading monooxygenase HmoA
MIQRVWRGWTAPEKADEYQRFLQDAFLPSVHAIPGYRGARVLRRNTGDEVEFMTITRFDSLAAIRAFAGDDLERAHVADAARALLAHWNERVDHYEIAFDDDADAEAVTDRKRGTDLALRSAAGGAVSIGALAAGAAAISALAVGVVAIGALAVGRLSIGKARLRRLEIDELSVGAFTGADAAREAAASSGSGAPG